MQYIHVELHATTTTGLVLGSQELPSTLATVVARWLWRSQEMGVKFEEKFLLWGEK